MVSVPLLTERMGVSYFEENLLELYLQVGAKSPPKDWHVSVSSGCECYLVRRVLIITFKTVPEHA